MPSRRMRSMTQLWADDKDRIIRPQYTEIVVSTRVDIRPATADDVVAVNDIYNEYVVETHYTFDIEPMSLDARREWFTHYGVSGRYRLLVALSDGHVIGYACSSRFRPKV